MSRKPFVREVSKTGWYFKQPRYLRYMSREVTCIFIGAFALLLLCALGRLSEGQAAYESFLAALQGPREETVLLALERDPTGLFDGRAS